MKERVKAVRKQAGLSQTEFGKSLGVSLSAVSKWESGENVLSDAVVLLICQRYGISEQWLRTGEGDMVVPRTREEEILGYVSSLFSDSSLDFQRRLFSVLCRLPADKWRVLESIADELEKEG